MATLIGKISAKNIAFGGLVVAIIAAIIALVTWLFPEPLKSVNAGVTFEINFIGLPHKQDDAYYVTNNLIGGKDLSQVADFTLSPLKVEVVPHYSKDDKFGNIILRVSGKNGHTDFPLWSNFDKNSETKTLEFTSANIVELSGIQRNTTNINTNLMLQGEPYQMETLRFEVIRLSEPDRPYETKELSVKNSPWKQSVAVEYRDGWVLDYAVTNLGAPATFHCNMNLFTTLGDVSYHPDSAWSGTNSFLFGIDCGSFALETNETYANSMPINKDTIGKEFMHGRYLVQVYTFAERGDIIFQNGKNYENTDDMWLFANRGNLETFVICNDPGKTCAQTDTLPVDEVAIKAFPYDSWDELGNGRTYFVVRTHPVNNRFANLYVLDYWLDSQKDGWVGFGIEFENQTDVSQFNSLRFKVKLDKSQHPIWLDVKNKIDNEYKTVRVTIGNGTYGAMSAEEQTIVIPFEAFDGIDWTQIDSLYFGIDSFNVPDIEEHEIQVSEIEFIR